MRQVGLAEWEETYSFSGSGKDGVSDCRCDRRRSGLADAGRGFGAWHDVYFDLRSLVDAYHRVIVEIGLLDFAVLQRNFAIERRAQPEDDSALNLGFYGIGINHTAAIDCADNFMHA